MNHKLITIFLTLIIIYTLLYNICPIHASSQVSNSTITPGALVITPGVSSIVDVKIETFFKNSSIIFAYSKKSRIIYPNLIIYIYSLINDTCTITYITNIEKKKIDIDVKPLVTTYKMNFPKNVRSLQLIFKFHNANKTIILPKVLVLQKTYRQSILEEIVKYVKLLPSQLLEIKIKYSIIGALGLLFGIMFSYWIVKKRKEREIMIGW